MQAVAKFHKCEDAYLFRAFLGSEGIEAHIFDEYTPQNYWLYTSAIGGIRVMVGEDDFERASDLLAQYERTITAGPPVVGEVKIWPLALILSFVVGAPLMLFGRKVLAAKNGIS